MMVRPDKSIRIFARLEESETGEGWVRQLKWLRRVGREKFCESALLFRRRQMRKVRYDPFRARFSKNDRDWLWLRDIRGAERRMTANDVIPRIFKSFDFQRSL